MFTIQETIKATIQDIATELLTLPTPTHVQQHTKAVLATTQPTSIAYHNHKVCIKAAMQDIATVDLTYSYPCITQACVA